MLLRKLTSNQCLLTKVEHMVVLWIVIAVVILLVGSTVEINGCFLSIRSLVYQQPTAEVIETMTLESQLNSTLTTKLTHESIH